MEPVFERPVFGRARRMCLALPETTEATSWGHPTFCAGKKVFCAFELFDGRPSIAFRMTTAEARRLVRLANVFPTPYGRGAWVSLHVDVQVDQKMIEKLIQRSYRQVATKRAIRLMSSTAKPR